MPGAVLTCFMSFISTNLDDIFVLMLLYAQAQSPKERRSILVGQSLGAAILLSFSLLAAFGIGLIPKAYLRLLGLLPILLGIRAWRKRGEPDDDLTGSHLGAMSVMLLALANGADNIGIYVPLFVGTPPAELVVFIAVHAVMLPLWCKLGQKLAGLPGWGRKIQTYKTILVPVVFILLGIYILLNG